MYWLVFTATSLFPQRPRQWTFSSMVCHLKIDYLSWQSREMTKFLTCILIYVTDTIPPTIWWWSWLGSWELLVELYEIHGLMTLSSVTLITPLSRTKAIIGIRKFLEPWHTTTTTQCGQLSSTHRKKQRFWFFCILFFLSYYITRIFSASSCTTPVEDSVESLFLKISLAKQCFKGYYDPTFVDPVRVLADRDPIGSNPEHVNRIWSRPIRSDPGFVNDQSSRTRQNISPKMEVLKL